MKLKIFVVLFISMLCGMFFQSLYAVEFLRPSGVYVSLGGVAGYTQVSSLKGTIGGADTNLNDESESGMGVGPTAAIGYAFDTLSIRLEAAYAYRTNFSFKNTAVFVTGSAPTHNNISSDIDNQTFMLNGYYDIILNSDTFVPYLMVGAGAAYNAIKLKPSGAKQVNTNTTGFAWQAGIGLRFKVNNNFYLNLAYQHVSLGKLEWGPWDSNVELKSDDFSSDEALVSVVIYFGNQGRKLPVPTLINDY
jgi:opacity protein-like surface antigen